MPVFLHLQLRKKVFGHRVFVMHRISLKSPGAVYSCKYKLVKYKLVYTSSLCIVLSSSELDVPSTHPEHDSTKKRTREQVFLFCLLNYKELNISICWCAFDAAKPFEPHTKKILWQMLTVIITIIED